MSDELSIPQRWDIFCTVVDNYGDIGVCWRLARQLAAEYRLDVQLFVDDLRSFSRICPAVDPALERQLIAGVTVLRWHADMAPAEVGQVVVEAFACELPEAHVAAMAEQPVAPVWINLEYLSAEDWVTGCHGLPSRHPRLPLTKHFFFPGFVQGTGGVLAERDLATRRLALQSDPQARAAYWRGLGIDVPAEALSVSLFAYENAAIPGLLGAWAHGARPVVCAVPEGRALGDVLGFFGVAEAGAGTVLRQGALSVHVLPFVAQPDYDRLLFACDLNFVRGEDSFVRAQWAARPFVWHIYPQEDEAHWDKLEAFLSLYLARLEPQAADALARFWRAWNRGAGADAAWPALAAALPQWHAHAQRWTSGLTDLGDLASNLVQFCANRYSTDPLN